jgi:hypothetical protein
MTSNIDFSDSNCQFIHQNVNDIFKRHIICFDFESVDILNIKEIIKERIIYMVSGMVSDFREEDFRFDVELNVDYESMADIFQLKINLHPLHPYANMIFKTKNFHILSRKLKIEEIINDELS